MIYHFSTLILAFISLAAGVAVPNPVITSISISTSPAGALTINGNGNGNSKSVLVTLKLYANTTCTGTQPRVLSLEADMCYTLNGARGLIVQEHTEGLKYNALRVYKSTPICHAGWGLEPIYTDGGLRCSDVSS